MTRAVEKIVAFLNVTVLRWAFVWIVVFHHPWIAERPEDKKAPGSGTTRLPKEGHVSEGLNSQQRHCENVKSKKGGGDDDDDDDNCSFSTCSSLLIYVMTVLSDDQLQKVSVNTRNITQSGNKNKRKTMEQKYN